MKSIDYFTLDYSKYPVEFHEWRSERVNISDGRFLADSLYSVDGIVDGDSEKKQPIVVYPYKIDGKWTISGIIELDHTEHAYYVTVGNDSRKFDSILLAEWFLWENYSKDICK